MLIGPLIYYNEGRATVVGVVSTGNGCGYDRFPGIFGRVTAVLDWINEELALGCSDFEESSSESYTESFSESYTETGPELFTETSSEYYSGTATDYY